MLLYQYPSFILVVELDEMCPSTDACITSNSECDSNTSTCLCVEGFYDNNGVGEIGGECSESTNSSVI